MKYLFMLSIVLLSKPLMALDCEQAYTTIEINQCAQQTLIEAENKMQQYLDKSLAQFPTDDITRESIQQAQTAWQAYRKVHCDSIYNQWREGTIRTAMAIACETELTDQRTKELWVNFLSFMDGSKPVLPEP